MLQSLHGAAKQWVGLLLFLMLILSFVVWGIADVFNGNIRQTSPVRVGDVEIAAQQLNNEVRQDISYLSQMTGRVLSLKEAADFGLIGRTVRTLIDRALLEQEARRLGLRVPDEMILNALREIPQMKNPDGTFNTASFRAALANAGMTEQGYIQSQRITLAREQLMKAVSGGASAPALLQQALAAAKAETRTLETYQVKYSAQPAPAAPSDDTLNAFIKDNADQFTRPEYRQLSFVRLSIDTVGQEMAVDDKEIADVYAERKDEFNTPEQRSFVQIVTTDEAKANAISAAAQGKDLTAAAKANDVDAAPLVNVTKDDLPEELQATAFNLSNKQVSTPIQSALGWHILQATSIIPAKEKQMAEVKDKIIADIRAQKAGDIIVKESQQLDDLLASGSSLEEISQALNLPIQQVAAVDSGGKDDKGNPVSAIRKAVLLTEAFKLAEGAQSNLITADDDYYVVKADKVTPSAVKPLAEIRSTVVAAYNKAEQQKAAIAKAEALEKALAAGQSFEGAANQFKAESSIESKLTRATPFPNYLPEEFGDKIFALKKNEIAQTKGKDAVIVVRLQKIDHPVAVKDAKVDKLAAGQLKETLSSELLQSYTTQLKKRYPVKIDESQIANIFKPDDTEE